MSAAMAVSYSASLSNQCHALRPALISRISPRKNSRSSHEELKSKTCSCAYSQSKINWAVDGAVSACSSAMVGGGWSRPSSKVPRMPSD